MELFPYQKQGINWLKGKQKALLFDEMGLGKTVQAIMAADHDKPLLVICPAYLRMNWADELSKWGYPNKIHIVYKKKDIIYPAAKEAVIISYSMLPDITPNIANYTTLIADECH